ncbi:MAG: AI-2E family transporter [Myxococcota bacterium]
MAQRTQTVCLVILTTLAVAAALRWLAPVMIPFVLSVSFAFVLTPLIDLQQKRLRIPRGAALGATLVIAVLLFWTLGALVTASVGQLAANAGAYQQQAAKLIDLAAASLPLERLGIDPGAVYEPLEQFSSKTLGIVLVGTTNAILDIVSNGVLVFIFLVFLLLGASGTPPEPGSTWFEIDRQIKRYVVAKSILSAVTGMLVGGFLAILGIDLALVFGLFAFLLNFIPSIGSIIATLLPLPVVMVSPGISVGAAALAIAVPGAIQFVVGSIVEPKVMGGALDLHPVAILMNLIVWGMLWGIVGMLLSTPILVVIKILCERLEVTRPVVDVLAGRIRGLRS